jgi:hypothetical protein
MSGNRVEKNNKLMEYKTMLFILEKRKKQNIYWTLIEVKDRKLPVFYACSNHCDVSFLSLLSVRSTSNTNSHHICVVEKKKMN